MKNKSIVKKTIGNVLNAYFAEVEFHYGSALNYPFCKGYYLSFTPCKIILDENGKETIEKDSKYEMKELLFEIEEPDDKAMEVALNVADMYTETLIMSIEQIKIDEKRRENNMKLKMKNAKSDLEMDIDFLKNRKGENNDKMSGMKFDDKKNDDVSMEKPKTTLDDVAGLEEVKVELKELIDGFNNKEKYAKFDIKPPMGVLLEGVPGNGKTMLARAIAGESDANFFSVVGSEFIEKYVGVGAKRVRELFEKARKNKPSIIFIDEIDAIGGRREEENNKESNSTLNQLLAEMTSDDNEDILIIGATNRMDILDAALTRRGRLDRHIHVPNPDKNTRLEILKLYVKNKPIAEDVDLEEVARRTSGCSGADMEGIITEGAMLAIRANAEEITQEMLLKAIDRMVAGLERKSTEMIEFEKDVVSHHEAGHLMVSMVLDGTRKPNKITIVPHGEALGYVSYHEEEDRFIKTREELMQNMLTSLGGLVSEKVFFNHESTGCSSDLGTVTAIARRMVTKYGMSDLGKMAIDERNGFMQEKIYEEMKKIVDEAYEKTLSIVNENKEMIHFIANELKVRETLEGGEIEELIQQFKMD